MSAHLSLSESFHASVIVQQQQQPNHHKQEERRQDDVGLICRLLLVASLFGVEACMTFAQIYQILILEYMGVPVSLMSVTGVISGVVSILILPVIGYFSDKGDNTKRRKMMLLLLGMTVFLTDLILMMVAAFLKISDVKDALHILDNFEEDKLCSNVTNTNSCLTLSNISSEASENTSLDSPALYSEIPVTAYLTIVAFSLSDAAFDISTPIIRAFVVQTVPSHQHTKLLVTATLVQAISGMVFSFIGTFDLPKWLGPMFNVDGTAATVVFLCCIIFLTVASSFSTTVITGYVINRGRREKVDSRVSSMSLSSSERAQPVSTKASIKSQLPVGTGHQGQHGGQPTRTYVPDILHTEEFDISTKPLFLEDSLKLTKYSSFDSQPGPPSDDKTDEGHRTLGRIPEYETNTVPTHTDLSVSETAGDQNEKQFLSIRQSLSHDATTTTDKSRLISKKPRFKWQNLNKRLAILCVSSFLGTGCLLSFVMYSGNALTIGIFHGEPTALPGTPGQDRYQDGLRTAAKGNLVLYITYVVLSLAGGKIIDWIGEKLQFVLIHVILLSSLLWLVLSHTMESYYLTMALFGAFRTCVFTVPFVLANKFTREEEEKETKTNKPGTKKKGTKIGKVMTLIGILMPAHMLVLSSFMGPLIAATDEAFAPLMYSLGNMAASVAVFSLLFYVKK